MLLFNLADDTALGRRSGFDLGLRVERRHLKPRIAALERQWFSVGADEREHIGRVRAHPTATLHLTIAKNLDGAVAPNLNLDRKLTRRLAIRIGAQRVFLDGAIGDVVGIDDDDIGG